MILHARLWGEPAPGIVVCLHGITQSGGVFAGLGQRLAESGRSVLALDLRGHGKSCRDAPWNTESHVADVLATFDALGIESATWVGHSFGGRVAAAIASSALERTDGLVLLDPGLAVPADHAMRGAEMDRLDWSFASPEGVVNAVMASAAVVNSPRQLVAEFVKDEVVVGSDGRFRLGHCPSAVVVAWSEMALPPPPIAPVDTLVVRAEHPLFDSAEQVGRYAASLGSRLTQATVPGGHNVMWESPAETIEAIERFLARESTSGEPLNGYTDSAGVPHPLL